MTVNDLSEYDSWSDIDFWGSRSLDLDAVKKGYPALASFVDSRAWRTGSDRRFARAVTARIPTLLSLGPSWGAQVAHLLNGLVVTVHHDRAQRARWLALRRGLRTKIFDTTGRSGGQATGPQGSNWRLVHVEDESAAIPLDVIDKAGRLAAALHDIGDEVDEWLVGHEVQVERPRRLDPVLLGRFGPWLVEIARWRGR